MLAVQPPRIPQTASPHKPPRPATAAGYSRPGRAPEPPTVVIEKKSDGTPQWRYQRGKLLGKGGFARVYRAQCLETGDFYALKCVWKPSLKKGRAFRKLMDEIKIQASLSHPGIVRYHSFFTDTEFIYIVLELCRNYTLIEMWRARGRLTEPEVRYIMKCILEATQYMHHSNVIHRDLKLGNILLDEGMNIKIGDFGLAAQLQTAAERKKTICGTPNYIAPEILESRTGHSFEVDVWSIGVIVYTLLVGRPPFETQDVKQTYQRIRDNSYSFPPDKPISEAARSLIRRSLSSRPELRPTVAEMMNHRFMTIAPIPRELPRSSLQKAPSFTDDGSPISVPHSSQEAAPMPTKSRTPLRTLSPNRLARGASPARSAPYKKLMEEEKKENAQSPKKPAKRHSPMKPQKPLQASPEVAAKQTAALAMARDWRATAEPAQPATVWVSKWVDYSNKYGLGYQLCQGNVGVFFNDSTKIILAPGGGDRVDYVERVRNGTGHQDVTHTHTMGQTPDTLQKKVTLLNYFRNYLNEHLLKDSIKAPSEEVETDQVVYVKKWMRTQHAIIFRLSNKTLQVNFYDHAKIILSPDGQVVTYVNKKRETSNHVLADVMQGGEDMEDLLNRLKYAKDVLFRLMSGRGGRTEGVE